MKRLFWPQLDGLRSLAFLLVFLSHVGPIRLPLAAFYDRFVAWGWVGVDLFFVLSGFLITSILLSERGQYGRISLRLFLLRRMLRIWPLYFLALFLGFIVLPAAGFYGVPLGGAAWKEMMGNYFIPYLLFVGNMAVAAKLAVIVPVVAPLWSVCIEEQFYLVWGSCFRWFRRRNTLVLSLVGALLLSIGCRGLIAHVGSDYQQYYYCSLSHLDGIVLGCLLAFFYNKWPSLRQGRVAALFGLSAALWSYLLVFSPTIFENDPFAVWMLFLVALACCTLLYSVMEWRPLQRLFSLEPIAKFGRLTYGMYIFHNLAISVAAKVATALVKSEEGIACWSVKLALALFLTWGMAWVSWRFFEHPFVLLKGRFARVASGYSS